MPIADYWKVWVFTYVANVALKPSLALPPPRRMSSSRKWKLTSQLPNVTHTPLPPLPGATNNPSPLSNMRSNNTATSSINSLHNNITCTNNRHLLSSARRRLLLHSSSSSFSKRSRTAPGLLLLQRLCNSNKCRRHGSLLHQQRS